MFCLVTTLTAITYGYLPSYRRSIYFSSQRGLYVNVIFWGTVVFLNLLLAPLVAYSMFTLTKEEMIATIVRGMDKMDRV